MPAESRTRKATINRKHANPIKKENTEKNELQGPKKNI
jgi:hypothetical protein